MSETADTKTTKKAAARPDQERERANRQPPGVWVAYSPDGTDGGVVIDSSEMKVLRHAVRRGWRACHWPFSSTLAEAIAADADPVGA